MNLKDQCEVIQQERINLQQLFKKQSKLKKIDETIFRSVWKNVVIRRLICTMIGEFIPVSAEKRIKLKDHYAKQIEQYKESPQSFWVQGNRQFYECPVLTASLFQYHYDNVKSDMECAIALVSGNPRNAVDTWLFRSVCDYMKRCYPSVLTMPSIHTWTNIIKSNNVELYNYAKTVLLMPELTEDLQRMVSLATDTHLYHWEVFNSTKGAISQSRDTKLLKALLIDLRLIDPSLETRWLDQCDYKKLVERGSIGILETIEKYAGDYYHRNEIGLMHRAIKEKQINSVRFLYQVKKIPIGIDTMKEIANTCHLPFVIELHNLEPDAGRLYTLFIYVMSSKFNRPRGTGGDCYRDFKREFYQLGKQLNYIDTNLQYKIDTKKYFQYQPKNQQHFKMFECNASVGEQNINGSSMPTLSFSSLSFDD
ncbi:hypothetical protein DFA_00287 [Cavenderia fasciculata]|uniref:Uncharacterized protein n=1 Tax=Cavenderia fasciculata TaxID=261658 RepID=F4PY49_CACFS|nr:uncharacterized protein DFA_00287 [Cavenderia fasciculata]EGG19709.1 hypothetical protein DFA_00287 [Cavenderia fasciculata]|eukprot:XP_004358003.1 hypothetical protein DFA_00287 [Cavenderia fasciculata]